MYRPFPVLAAAVVAASVAASVGCGIHGPYNAEARDSWSQTYSLSPDGEVSIGNTNGRIEIEGTDGSKVEVQAERIARAATDQLAHELLPKIPITDRSTADNVRIETGRINGILIGASFEVRYHVKVPKAAKVSGSTVNGGVEVSGLTGRVNAHTTNGGVLARDITGSLEARTVNGGVRVVLPPTAKATLNATWVNGGIRTNGLNFDVRDSGKRHFEGRLNGGGTQITATTVNGGVAVSTGDENDGDAGDFVTGIVEKSLKGADKKP